MNNIDLLIRQMIIEYPTLFRSRQQALGYIFCTAGGSYDWDENGTIVHMDEHDNETHKSKSESIHSRIEKYLEHITEKEFRYESDNYDGQANIKYMEEMLYYPIKAILAAGALAVDKTISYSNWYEISDSSNISNIPDNVTDGWLAVCIETLGHVINSPMPTHPDTQFHKPSKVWESNRVRATELLEQTIERFSERLEK